VTALAESEFPSCIFTHVTPPGSYVEEFDCDSVLNYGHFKS